MKIKGLVMLTRIIMLGGGMRIRNMEGFGSKFDG